MTTETFLILVALGLFVFDILLIVFIQKKAYKFGEIAGWKDAEKYYAKHYSLNPQLLDPPISKKPKSDLELMLEHQPKNPSGFSVVKYTTTTTPMLRGKKFRKT